LLLSAALALVLFAAAAARRAADASSAPPVAEPAEYWTGDINAPTPATLRGGRVINAMQVSELLKRRHVVIVDVSNAPRKPENLAPGAPWLPLPHPGIPGARWIPGAGLGVVPADIDDFFRAELRSATRGDFSRPVVIYCHERCWLSWNAAKRAISYGYHNVSWFPDGIEGWKAAGKSTKDLEPAGPGRT
jgi:PQQ-dependent catabolism-associated CXXCW motif protein